MLLAAVLAGCTPTLSGGGGAQDEADAGDAGSAPQATCDGGALCDACGAGEVCVQGVCMLACGSPTTRCGDACADTRNDPENCGGCGLLCAPGELCSMGQCSIVCLGGSTLCGDTCADTNDDPQNCGACGNVCEPGAVCSMGQCGSVCLGGTLCASFCGPVMYCPGTCVDTRNDPQNCGACGNFCPEGEVCSSGQCSVVCLGGTTLCGSFCGPAMYCPGTCVDTRDDPQNCGACGNFCAEGEVCSMGACAGGGNGAGGSGAGGNGAGGAGGGL